MPVSNCHGMVCRRNCRRYFLLSPRKERHETSLSLRYDFNYCTYSYTMAFLGLGTLGERNRLDGSTWYQSPFGSRRPGMYLVQYASKLGYSKDEINRFIAGPAFLAWWAMNNLEGWADLIRIPRYVQQEALQKKILKRMREYGIKPVFRDIQVWFPRC